METRQTYLRADECDVHEFAALVEAPTDLSRYPHAAAVEHRTVIYEATQLQQVPLEQRRSLMAELADALLDGPGVIVFKGAMQRGPIERANALFQEVIAEQRASKTAVGDHFAKAGANDRIWNSLEKHCLRDPGGFIDYFNNEIIALVCEAWLGPRYQMSAQVNQVNPGGQAQAPHRDYHLGFLTDEQAEQFPPHVHRLSPVLTLQGAVAHCDMPVETGPTMYLPHSQKFEAGYLAWRRPDFQQYFADNAVQIPLEMGDMVFFNPALFHAAGSNQTGDVLRLANLLQVSSAFGRAMEDIDRRAMVAALYPELSKRQSEGADARALARVIAASAEGYAFPNDLDRDQPLDGLAPESMADKVRRALAEGQTLAQLTAAMST